jgi:ribosomal protein S18 acetylase RimI-like enzyme
MKPALQRLRDPSPKEFQELESVLLGAPRFSLLTEGRPPRREDAAEMLSALPPHATLDQKHFFAIYLGRTMAGCADVIRGWPRADTAHLGLLMLSESYQGMGHGRRAYRELEQLISSWSEIRCLRLAIIESNQPAFPFWRALGFVETGERARSARFIADLVYFEKPLAPQHA